jgi:3-oxoadipate enol-lactonase
VRVEDHADDARAVLDAFDMPSATVVGWSLGVNVAFELALEQSSRVRSLLAVAGVPGGSFSAMFAPYGVPRRLRAPAGRLLPVVGPLLPVVVASLPPWHELLTPAGFTGPAREATHPAALYQVLHEFSRHDWRWYRHLALAVAARRRGRPSRRSSRRARRRRRAATGRARTAPAPARRPR